MSQLRIIFLGAPGAGKGTQAKLLAENRSLVHISTGDMLRQAVSEGTELGKVAKEIMDSGQLVSDSLMIGLIRDRVAQTDCENGYILDGFPRTVPQAKALDAFFQENSEEITSVVLFEVPEEEVLTRLSIRRKEEGRSDDNVETQKERLEVYQEKTAPLIDYYQKSGKLIRVKASGEIEEIFSRVKKVFA